MKTRKILLFIIIGIFIPFVTFSNDTITVQTFTFDSIFTRQAIFKFPDVNEKFQRVIAKYRLKCDPKTQHDKYNCGEWDYLAFMNIFKPTNEFNFSKRKHPRVTFGNFNKPDIGVKILKDKPNFDTVNIVDVKPSAVSENENMIELGEGSEKLNDFSRHRFLLFNKDLEAKGIVKDSKIGKISFEANILDTMRYVKVRIAFVKKLTQQIIYYNEDLDFQEVAYQTYVTPNDCKDNKLLILNFNQDLVYDGLSNLIVELMYLPINNSRNIFKGSVVSKNIAITVSNANFIRLNGNDAWINSIPLPTISGGQHFTFEGWIKMRDKGVIFRLGDKVVVSVNNITEDNNASLNIKLSNEKNMLAFTNSNPLKINEWAHIAVVYDGEGELCSDVLKLFINSKPVTLEYHKAWENIYMPRFIDDLPVNFSIGQGEYIDKDNITSNTDGDFSKIRVWDISLTNQQIVEWYNKDITDEHPCFSNLLLNFDINNDENGATSIINMGTLKTNANIIGPVEILNTFESPKLVNQTNFIPNINFYVGDFIYSKKEENVKKIRLQSPITLVYFNGLNNYPMVEKVDYKYGNYIYKYDFEFNKIDSINVQDEFDEYIIDDELFSYETKHYPKKQVYEIGRFVTPYGINLSLGENGFEWEYDLTDYMNDLRGEVELEAHNNQELIDLKFLFIKGEPSRDILRITEPWGPVNTYSYYDLGKDIKVTDTTITILPNTKAVKLKVRLTGHGMVPNTSHPAQCCEFLDNTHYLYAGPTMDEYEIAGKWKIWQQCTDNPVWPQGGTWMLMREGWCPGDIVKDYEIDLTNYVSDNKITINYEISTDSLDLYPEIGSGNYFANFHLVEYGAAKYKKDLELFKIITPSIEDIYSKLNPICNGIKFVVRNNSDESISNFEVVLVNGSENEKHLIEKVILPRAFDTINIMLNDAKFWLGSNDNKYNISIMLKVDDDDNLDNNTGEAIFNIPDIYNKSNFQIKYLSNLRASDYSLKIYDFRNEVVKVLPATINSKTYNFTLNDLPNGCYRFELTDERYYFGLSSWMVPNQGNGAIAILDGDGKNLKTFNPDFGKRLVYSFVLDGFTNIASKDIKNSVLVYPNPTNNFVIIKATEDFGLATIKIYDINGNIVISEQHNMVENNVINIDVSKLLIGYYSICVSVNDKEQWSNFVKK